MVTKTVERVSIPALLLVVSGDSYRASVCQRFPQSLQVHAIPPRSRQCATIDALKRSKSSGTSLHNLKIASPSCLLAPFQNFPPPPVSSTPVFSFSYAPIRTIPQLAQNKYFIFT